jgi:putative hydrolase of the HAD superfamily
MIKHILFDADGVLVHAEMFSVGLEAKYGITHEQTQPFYRGVFQGTLKGDGDLKELIEPYLKEWGWTKTVDDFLNEWFEYEHILDDEIIAYIQKLRADGYKCYLATNQEKYRGQYMIDKMGFGKSFDKTFVSAHLGVGKPDVEFFEKVVKVIGAKKDEVLFWDDAKENIEGAKKFGIHAEFFESFDTFKDIMKDKYEISS